MRIHSAFKVKSSHFTGGEFLVRLEWLVGLFFTVIRRFPTRFECEYTWGRMPKEIHPTRKALRTVALCSAIVFMVLLLAWMLIPTMDVNKRQRANQATAYVAVKDLSAALGIFKQQHGGFPRKLEPVHDAFVDIFLANDGADRDSAERIWRHFEDHELGYTYEYIPSQEIVPSNGSLSAHFEIRADPVERGKTGFESFYVSDKSTIRWNTMRRAGQNDPGAE